MCWVWLTCQSSDWSQLGSWSISVKNKWNWLGWHIWDKKYALFSSYQTVFQSNWHLGNTGPNSNFKSLWFYFKKFYLYIFNKFLIIKWNKNSNIKTTIPNQWSHTQSRTQKHTCMSWVLIHYLIFDLKTNLLW